MSIIHEALKRKERLEAGDTSVPERGAAGPGKGGAAFWQAPWFPGALAASGVLLAATLTYLVTRPGEITVVLPPPAQPTSATLAAPGGTAPVAPELAYPAPTPPVPPGYAFQPAYPAAYPGAPPASPAGTAHAGTYGATGVPTGVPVAPGPQAATGEPGAGYPADAAVASEPSAGTPSATATTSEYPHIPVYGAIPGITPGVPSSPAATAANPAQTGSRVTPSTAELPPNAVTIEMSQGRLESFSGGVSVNSTVPQPGAPVRVGTVVSTQPGAAATLAFENAQVDVAGASTARVSRLERRSDPSGSAREEVTVHLANGNARTVVRPGGGQVLISTDQVTAAASSGAFQVQARADGSVTVQSEGGQVRLVPRSGEPMTLGVGQQATWRNGAWE